MRIDDLVTPALLVDRGRLEENIRWMAAKARRCGVSLRPHAKTHKSPDIARIQIGAGAVGLTVSTVAEARVFSTVTDDLTLAVPLAPDKIPAVRELHGTSQLRVLVDHPAPVGLLERVFDDPDSPLGVLLKIDCGYHRCGLAPRSNGAIGLASRLHSARGLRFEGVLTHGGHAYAARDMGEVLNAAHQEQESVHEFIMELERRHPEVPVNTVSIGSTPTMTLAESIGDWVTEIRPGNYVFYDYTQVGLGVCSLSQVAMSVVASVIGVYDGRVVVDAGATALSLDPGPRHVLPDCGYGVVVTDWEEGTVAPDTRVVALSQEHGKIAVGPDSPLRSARPGDRVRIVPNHSCLVANLFDQYSVVSGDEVVGMWRVYRGHMVRPH